MDKKETFLSWTFCNDRGLRKEQEEDKQSDTKKITRKYQRHDKHV